MRRLTLCLVVACAVAAPTASVAPAKSDNGVMCALHAKLAAKNETTGSTSTAKGNTLIKVRMTARSSSRPRSATKTTRHSS